MLVEKAKKFPWSYVNTSNLWFCVNASVTVNTTRLHSTKFRPLELTFLPNTNIVDSKKIFLPFFVHCLW